MRAALKAFPPQMVLSLLGIAWADAVCAAEFKQDFRGRRFDPKLFLPTGVHTQRTVRFEPGGLRLTLPADHKSKLPVGLVARARVRGDFEITLAYEIRQIDKPSGANGAGVGIYITMVSPTKEAATISRQVRPSGERVFTAHRASTPSGEKRVHRGGKPLPAKALSGTLCLVRKGPTLSYLVAEGDSNAFKQFYETELGTDDLDMVRFAVDNGGVPTFVDVRVSAVGIRADEFPGPPEERPSWPFGVIVCLTAALLGAVGWWFWSRARRVPGVLRLPRGHGRSYGGRGRPVPLGLDRRPDGDKASLDSDCPGTGRLILPGESGLIQEFKVLQVRQR